MREIIGWLLICITIYGFYRNFAVWAFRKRLHIYGFLWNEGHPKDPISKEPCSYEKMLFSFKRLSYKKWFSEDDAQKFTNAESIHL